MTLDPVTFEVLRHRLETINDEAALTIARVSGSPVAHEALDLNTCLMTPGGQVVVTGMYVLVQVVSLAGVVEDILANYAENPGIGPGDMFVTNDPYVGAPHQPDVIVTAPIFHDSELLAWSCAVVHQSDVGGPTTGSINISARTIWEEPIPIAPMRLVEGGVLRRDIEREVLIRSRTPELNALDLRGQIAANRFQAAKLAALCQRYGAAAVRGTMERLVSSTEAGFRALLASLPDGTWRHQSFIEHTGADDTITAVRLTMHKRGDELTLDFRDSDDEVPSGINGTEATVRNFAMAAVLALLGFDLPWVPAGYWPALRVLTRPGSVVHARWPAAVAMAVNASGQEIRTCVNACLARLLDSSDTHAGYAMASCMSAGPAQLISGKASDGRPFATMLLDGLLGGGGARPFADGADVAGLITSPGAACANIEVVEQHYPIRYAYRREAADSAGPGQWRGGLSAEQMFVGHGVLGDIETTVFAHGVELPASTGVVGGEPGRSITMAIGDRPLAPKAHDVIPSGTTYRSRGPGGGGWGDPLEREAAAVEADVAAGVVSVDGALRDYGVVVGDGDATAAERERRRRARLGGTAPQRRAPDAAGAGTRLSCGLMRVGERLHCRACGVELGPAAANARLLLRVESVPTDHRGRFELRRFHCPACALQIDVEVARAGDAPIDPARLA